MDFSSYACLEIQMFYEPPEGTVKVIEEVESGSHVSLTLLSSNMDKPMATVLSMWLTSLTSHSVLCVYIFVCASML